MGNKSLLMTIATAAAICSSNSAVADVIELRADLWCPYNCEPGGEKPGYLVELAREALAPYGHEINYETMNWPRSLQFTREGRVNGVIGAIPEEAEGFVFGPSLGTYMDVVAFQAGKAVDINLPTELEGLRVGAINGYEYIGPVSEYIDAHRENPTLVQFTSGDDALKSNLRKLRANRLDLVAEVHAVLAYTVAELNMETDIEIVSSENVDDIFIAFSPALESSQMYADQLAEGIKRLRQTGRYDEIMSHYGL